MDNWRALRSVTLKALSLTLLLACFSFSNLHAQEDGKAGKKLFKQNCASCHSTGTNKLTGPGLAGVFDGTRVPDEEWALQWVKNSDKMIKSGDPYAVKIFSEYKSQMTAFEYLSDDEIKNIFTYIKNPSEFDDTPPPPPSGGDDVAGVDPGPDYTAYILLGVALLLVVLIIVLTGVQKSLQVIVSEKAGLPTPADRSFLQSVADWFKHNKAITIITIVIIILFGLKLTWDGLMGVGVYQGYEPEQPIAYNHKLHAGDNGVACVYCHFGAEKGRAAGIPPANVCMNCHKAIQEGPSGKGEIAKIYEALDYDPEKGTYGPNQKPIEWVRVHNLPDHVYFNHSQHVVVGKIECETCHGPVKDEFTVGKQFAPLTMGWCINCHQETGVQMADNGYYEDIHERYKGQFKAGENITVAKLGGMECGKCHY